MIQPLRLLGALLLVIGIPAIGLRFPSRPAESWEFVHVFRFDDAECRALRQLRQTTRFACPESVEETVTVSEVARRYGLELALVCQANDLAADCGGRQLAPGESLVLPLPRGAPLPDQPPLAAETR